MDYFYDDGWAPPAAHTSQQQAIGDNSWGGWSFNHVMGLSFVASFLQNDYLFNSFRLLILGTIIETGRRLCYWLIERFKFQYGVTARFDEGDPTYDWILLFLTEHKVWCRSQDFLVNARNSKRKWGIKAGSGFKVDENAEYVPTYEMPQLFRWNGYWVEVKRSKFGGAPSILPHSGPQSSSMIYISIYTFDTGALSVLVQEARTLYKETSRPNVVVYSADVPTYGPGFVWSSVKNKARRPLSSIILLDGVINSLIKDVQEFLASEDWYIEAGIPYRRGYLLHGPPGTGKTSTIYALAGELGLEIYSLSLSSSFVDDSFLQKAASSIPKHSIFLIEDIDCAFPPREDLDSANAGYYPINPQYPMVPGIFPNHLNPIGQKRSLVTLSGLLNVLDGVGSEEGKLFFATTNYIDRLDAALLRPGRIDKKMQYFQATQAQAAALFTRFYGRRSDAGHVAKAEDEKPAKSTINETRTGTSTELESLAKQFSSHIPLQVFSTAELQGYLLLHKKDPQEAVKGVEAWVEGELEDRAAKKNQEEERLKKQRERMAMNRAAGTPYAFPVTPLITTTDGLGGGCVDSDAPPPPPLPGAVPAVGAYPVYSHFPARGASNLPVTPLQIPTPPDTVTPFPTPLALINDSEGTREEARGGGS